MLRSISEASTAIIGHGANHTATTSLASAAAETSAVAEQTWAGSMQPFLCDLAFLLQTSHELPASMAAAATSEHVQQQLHAWVGLAHDIISYLVHQRLVWTSAMVLEMLAHAGLEITNGGELVLRGQMADVLEQLIASDGLLPTAAASKSSAVAAADGSEVTATSHPSTSSSSVEFTDAAWELEAAVNSGSAAQALPRSVPGLAPWAAQLAEMLQCAMALMPAVPSEAGGLAAITVGTVVALFLSQVIRAAQQGLGAMLQTSLLLMGLLLLGGAVLCILSVLCVQPRHARTSPTTKPSTDTTASMTAAPSLVPATVPTTVGQPTPSASAPAVPAELHPLPPPNMPGQVLLPQPHPAAIIAADPAPSCFSGLSGLEAPPVPKEELPGTPTPQRLGPQDFSAAHALGPDAAAMGPDAAAMSPDAAATKQATAPKSPGAPEPQTPEASELLPVQRQVSSTVVRRSLFDDGQPGLAADLPAQDDQSDAATGAGTDVAQLAIAPTLAAGLPSPVRAPADGGQAQVVELVAPSSQPAALQDRGTVLPGVQEMRCAVIVRDVHVLPGEQSAKATALALIRATSGAPRALHNSAQSPHSTERGSPQQLQLSEPLPRLQLLGGGEQPGSSDPALLPDQISAPAGYKETFSIFQDAAAAAAASFAPPRSPGSSGAPASPGTADDANFYSQSSFSTAGVNSGTGYLQQPPADIDALMLCTLTDDLDEGHGHLGVSLGSPFTAAAAASPTMTASDASPTSEQPGPQRRLPPRRASIRRSHSFHMADHAKWKQFLARATGASGEGPGSPAKSPLLLPGSPGNRPAAAGPEESHSEALHCLSLIPAASSPPGSPVFAPAPVRLPCGDAPGSATLHGAFPTLSAAAAGSSTLPKASNAVPMEAVVQSVSAVPSVLPGWHEVHCALLVRDPHVKSLTARSPSCSVNAATSSTLLSSFATSASASTAASAHAAPADRRPPSQLSSLTDSILSSLHEPAGQISSHLLHTDVLQELVRRTLCLRLIVVRLQIRACSAEPAVHAQPSLDNPDFLLDIMFVAMTATSMYIQHTALSSKAVLRCYVPSSHAGVWPDHQWLPPHNPHS